MTPKMVAALKAALAADAAGGLCRTVAGWIDPGDCWNHHGPVVVSRLVWTHGFLAETGKGRGKNARRVITDTGRAWLAENAAPIKTPLAEIIQRIDAGLPKKYEAGEWRDADAKAMTLIREFEREHGARYRGGNEHRLSLAGVKVTCTAGRVGLLRNWQNAARRRLAARP